LPDGRNMLAGFHTTGKMLKVPTKDIEMTPDLKTVIDLDELNTTIAQQKGVTVADLALKNPDGTQESAVEEVQESVDPVELYTSDTPATIISEEVLTDEKLAAQYRSQADALFKEAKSLREKAKDITDRLKSEDVGG